MSKSKKPETNWKEIALALAGSLKFVVEHVRAKDTGATYNVETGEIRHWKEDLADKLEMIPGLKVDREAMHALELPKRERDKFFAERKRFTDWMHEVNRIAKEERGYSVEIQPGEEWKAYFNDGLTPLEALNADESDA